MPTLRQTDEHGDQHEIFLDLRPGAGGRVPPLTLGPGAGAQGHVQVPGARVEARLLASGTTRSFVLGGAGISIAGRPIAGIRVLRHGDLIEMGGPELLYLDVSVRQLQAKPSGRCFSPTCSKPSVDEGSISCPWCTNLYHTSCWLHLKECADRGCYPIRRLLLAELAGELAPSRMEATSDAKLRVCTARCTAQHEALLIAAGAEVLRCPRCKSPYHPGCLLSLRGSCPKCDLDLRRLVAHAVFHSEPGVAS